MFKIGEKIVYGLNGIYALEDIREETVLGEKHTYYILNSLQNQNSKVFVPADNEQLVSTMRRPMTGAVAKELIADIKNIPEAKIPQDSKKKNADFKLLMEKGEPRALISLIKALYNNSKARISEGKKAYISDENFMKKAEKLLYAELALALDIPEEEVLSYIEEKQA